MLKNNSTWRSFVRLLSGVTMVAMLSANAGAAHAAVLYFNDISFDVDADGLTINADGGAGSSAVNFGAGATAGNINYDEATGEYSFGDSASTSGHSINFGGNDINLTGYFDGSGTTGFRIREDATPNATADCANVGEIILNTTFNTIMVCTTPGSPGVWAAVPASDADLLDGIDSTQFVRSDEGDTIGVNGGTEVPDTYVFGDGTNADELQFATNSLFNFGGTDFDVNASGGVNVQSTSNINAQSDAAINLNSATSSSFSQTANTATDETLNILSTNSGLGAGKLTLQSDDKTAINTAGGDIGLSINSGSSDTFNISGSTGNVTVNTPGNLFLLSTASFATLQGSTAANVVAAGVNSGAIEATIGASNGGTGAGNVFVHADDNGTFRFGENGVTDGNVSFSNDNGSTNFFEIDSSDDVQITSGNWSITKPGEATFSALNIGAIGLEDVGTNNTDSGASLVGVFDEFANSSSTTVQDVLDDLDAAITTAASTQQNFDDVYAKSVADGNTVMEIDDTAGLDFNMTTTGNFAIQDNGSDIFTFGNTGTVTAESGSTFNIAGTWQIGGVTITSTSSELNDIFTNTEAASNTASSGATLVGIDTTATYSNFTAGTTVQSALAGIDTALGAATNEQDFEEVYAHDGDNTLTTSNGDFTIDSGTGDFIVTSNNWSVDATGAADFFGVSIGGVGLADTTLGASGAGLVGYDTTGNTVITSTTVQGALDNVETALTSGSIGANNDNLLFHPEYPNTSFDNGGRGTLEGGLNDPSEGPMYQWFSTDASPQSIDVVTRVALPEDFSSLTNVVVRYNGDNATDNNVSVSVKDAAGNPCGSSTSTATSWTALIVSTGSCTPVAGTYLTVTATLTAANSNAAHLGALKVNYTN